MLDAAERLFALQGIETASLRDISVEAGQRNNSAVQYHFGDRAGVVAAVFTRRMDTINELRRAMINDLDERQCGDDIVGLVNALMFPLLEYITSHDGWYGRFLVRTEFDYFATTVKNALPVSVPVRDIMQRLVRQLTDLEPRVRHQRVTQMMTHYISAAADWEWARDRGERRMTPDELCQDLLATSVAILTAPAYLNAQLTIKEI